MKKSIIKFWDKIIVVLLGLLGVFNSCKSDCTDNSGGMVAKYGMPQATYEIKGTIKSKANSKPIPNIQISRQVSENHADTLYTDSKGNYIYRFYGYSLNSGKSVHLKFEDIDGEENGGNFATKEIDVKFTNANGNCSDGSKKYSKTQNIKLEKKKNVPLYGVQSAPFKE